MDVKSYLLGKKAGGGGGSVNNQNKSVTITENTTTNVTADAGYTGLGTVSVTTNVSGADLSNYFNTELGNHYEEQEGEQVLLYTDKWYNAIKQIPPLTVDTEYLNNFFNTYNGEELPETTFEQEAINIQYILNGCLNLKTADLTGIELDYEHMYLNVFIEEGQTYIEETGLDSIAVECPKLAVLDLSSMDFSQLTNEFLTYFEGRTLCYEIGNQCLEDDGAYADGVPLIYVSNVFSQNFVIEHGPYTEDWGYDEETGEETYTKTPIWTTDNVVIKNVV